LKRCITFLSTVMVMGVTNGDRAHAQGPVVMTNALLPAVTGTVVFWPELQLWRMPVGNAIQSAYFRTTALNREFRRGFLEFSIPAFDGKLVSATLQLAKDSAWISAPTPPDTHLLDYYEADLVIDTNDYHAVAEPLAEFETDVNISPESFSFDVGALVHQFQGRNLGLRIKLAADPDYFGEGFLGSGFQNNAQGSPARIVLVTSNVPTAVPVVNLNTVTAVAFEPPGRHQLRQDGLFMIRRSGDTSAALQIDAAIGGTALNGSDYEHIARVLTIPAGATAAAIVVRPFADRIPERPETVTVHLMPSSNGSYQLAARAAGRVIILDRQRANR